MNILIDLVNYPMLGQSSDCRYAILRALGDRLRARGHQVYTPETPQSLFKESGYLPYNELVADRIDFHIARSPYGDGPTVARFNFHRRRGVPGVAYEHGWLPDSMIMDRGKLFGDSSYYHSISSILDELDLPEQAEDLRRSMIARGASKRPQERRDPIPCEDFIFIPGQALHDCSIVSYAEIGLIDFLRRTVSWAGEVGLNVVYKPHPGLEDGNEVHGKHLLEVVTQEMAAANPRFFVVNTSIYDLIGAARFTACVNSGSIIDNIVSLSPVYACGRSVFTNSGAIVHDPDLRRGLERMINQHYDRQKMQDRQRRMLWWLHKHLLLAELSPGENLRRLEKLADLRF